MEHRFKRNYKACLNCRLRKVKCDLGSVDSPRDGKCARCLRERKDCVFVESRRGGTAPHTSGGNTRSNSLLSVPMAAYHSESASEHGLHAESTDPGPHAETGPEQGGHFSTMEGALVFLAQAAGTIAQADERDHIDAASKHRQLADNKGGSSAGDSGTESGPLAGSLSGGDASTRPGGPAMTDLAMALSRQRRTVPAADGVFLARPAASLHLAHIEYIGPTGLLTEQEAETLVHLFFTTMHPFFPHVPHFLHSPKTLSRYPILLCAILTISSRYYSLAPSDGDNRQPRNIELHDRLWLYVQRLISQTVWAEASTRLVGTIFAFLLFTEWNPRAIHWRWSDYANEPEPAAEALQAFLAHSGKAFPNQSMAHQPPADSSHAYLSPGPAHSPQTPQPLQVAGSENLAGLGAMRRSYRMAWMLIGLAVRLAQDMGIMEVSATTFLATHIAEINLVMNISRRSMLAHSLAEVDLDVDEEEDRNDRDRYERADLRGEKPGERGAHHNVGLHSNTGQQTQGRSRSHSHSHAQGHSHAHKNDLEYRVLHMSEDDIRRFAATHPLRFSRNQKAKIELLQIMSLGHESLYGHNAQLGALSQRQNLAVLNIMLPLLNLWARKYRDYLVPSVSRLLSNTTGTSHFLDPHSKLAGEVAEAIDRESFIFEFHYARLYVYSLALSPSPAASSSQRRSRRTTLKLDELANSAKYIEMAFTSANEMLSAAHRIHRLRLLRFMPVRWLTRIVRAVAFIVKCYLTITAHKNSAQTPAAPGFDSTVLSLSMISVDEIIHSIQRAAITLRDCSPDELHLCTRYSTVLMYLCSEMKTKAKTLAAMDTDEFPAAKRARTSPAFPASLRPQAASDPSTPAAPPVGASENHTREGSPQTGLVGDSEVMDWFMSNRDIGLDFVGPWTEMIEQQLATNDFDFDMAMDTSMMGDI